MFGAPAWVHNDRLDFHLLDLARAANAAPRTRRRSSSVGENFQRNLAIADEVQAVAADVGATPAQVAIAWLLAKGGDIAPIPGTRRVPRLEENVAADGVVLSAGQMKRLNELTPASGGHHNEAQMEMIER